MHYLRGHGVSKNFDEGLKWLTIAVSKGWVEAAFVLGTIYYEGSDDFIGEDWNKALHWHQKAIQEATKVLNADQQ